MPKSGGLPVQEHVVERGGASVMLQRDSERLERGRL